MGPKGASSSKMKELIGTDADPPYEVFYEFTGLKPAKNYIVDIEPTSDYPYTSYGNIDLTDGDQDNINLELLTDTRSIEGTITFPDNASNGETVWIYAWSANLSSENQTIITYEDTRVIPYKINGLKSSDDYIVSIESNVYKHQFYENTGSYKDATKVDLTQDQHNINFVLEKGALISGTVYDVDGTKMPNTRVEAWSDSTAHLGFINTDSNGHYEIGGLKLTDDYVVYISYNQSYFYYSTDGIVYSMNKATPVSTHQLANKIDFQLPETGIISGIVRDTNNKRLGNVMVTAQSVSNDANNGCKTNQLGRFIIRGLPVNNDYQVSATPNSETNYMSQTQTNISTGSTYVNFSLLKGYIVSGIIQSWTGEPVADAKVEFSSRNNIEPQPYYTEENGEFLIGGIAEGVYYFIVTAPDNSQLIDYFENGFVVDNNISGKMVTLRPATLIDGTVRLADSNFVTPLSDIMISIFSKSNSFWTSTITNSSGYYFFNNLPEATDYLIKNVSDNYLTHVEINRASGETVDFAIKPAAVLKGMLINAQTGAGIKNARIEVRYQGLIHDETRTDRNGRFQASSLESMINGQYAEYIVVAKYTDYPEVQARWTADQTDLLVLKLSRSDQNIINGYVFDKNENIPPENVKVVVQYYYEQDRRGYIGSVDCTDDGSFSIKGLSPDRNYHLKIVAKNSNNTKRWIGSNYAPVLKRKDALAVSPGQETLTFKFDNEW